MSAVFPLLVSGFLLTTIGETNAVRMRSIDGATETGPSQHIETMRAHAKLTLLQTLFHSVHRGKVEGSCDMESQNGQVLWKESLALSSSIEVPRESHISSPTKESLTESISILAKDFDSRGIFPNANSQDGDSFPLHPGRIIIEGSTGQAPKKDLFVLCWLVQRTLRFGFHPLLEQAGES